MDRSESIEIILAAHDRLGHPVTQRAFRAWLHELVEQRRSAGGFAVIAGGDPGACLLPEQRPVLRLCR